MAGSPRSLNQRWYENEPFLEYVYWVFCYIVIAFVFVGIVWTSTPSASTNTSFDRHKSKMNKNSEDPKSLIEPVETTSEIITTATPPEITMKIETVILPALTTELNPFKIKLSRAWTALHPERYTRCYQVAQWLDEEKYPNEEELLASFSTNETTEEKALSTLSETIIVNCPITSNKYYSTEEYHQNLADLLGKIKTHAIKNTQGQLPFKVWFNYNDGTADDVMLCTDLAVAGNKIFPGIFQGVVGNNSILMSIVNELLVNGSNSSAFVVRQHNLVLEYSQIANKFRNDTGLRLGFLLSPFSCFMFPAATPGNVIGEFDEIFFFQNKYIYYTIRNNLPICVDWDIYDECKNFVAEKATTAKPVKRVLEKDYLSYDEFFGIFDA